MTMATTENTEKQKSLTLLVTFIKLTCLKYILSLKCIICSVTVLSDS